MDFSRKGAMTRHRGFRAHGQLKRSENTTQITTPRAGAPEAPPEAAPLLFALCFRIVSAGRVLEGPWR
eukprot:16449989-Heterocapsa_arctica.AAC.1